MLILWTSIFFLSNSIPDTSSNSSFQYGNAPPFLSFDITLKLHHKSVSVYYINYIIKSFKKLQLSIFQGDEIIWNLTLCKYQQLQPSPQKLLQRHLHVFWNRSNIKNWQNNKSVSELRNQFQMCAPLAHICSNLT